VTGGAGVGTDVDEGRKLYRDGGLTIGKSYRATCSVSAYTDGSAALYGDGGNVDLENQGELSATGTMVGEWTCTAAGNVGVKTRTAGSDLSVDDFTITQIGAVAEYDGSGVAREKWYDKSGNELHGTVTGATDENTAGAPVISENHPAFLAHPASNQDDIAVGSWVPIVLGTERFDQGSNFASNTFTAPVTGKYQLNVVVRMNAADSASAYYQVRLVTSNYTYYSIIDPDFGQDAAYWNICLPVLADMDVSDTAAISIYQSGGTQQTDIHTETTFSGYLVC